MSLKEYNYSKFADIYDRLEVNENVKSFNPILEKLLKKFNVKKVVDMTCGTGEQSIYLHKKGYDLSAYDYNKDMIRVAKKKYPKINFKQGDIRKTNYGKFDAVISIFNSIGHLSKADFERALKNISNNLKERGIYIFDIFNLDFMKNNFRTYEFIDHAQEIDNFKFVRFNKNTLDKNRGIMHINQNTIIQENLKPIKRIKESWDMQIYSSKELNDILKRNGFEIINFLDMEGNKFNKDKSLFILTIARRK